MNCQRCGNKEGEYICSVCNRVVCSDCKVIDNGKVYCLDDAPKHGSQEQPQQEVKPKPSFKHLKELIYADFILLAGIAIIYIISNFLIAGVLMTNKDVISENFPQLSLVFDLLTFFEKSGLYAIVFLLLVLIGLIIVLMIKKHRYKNI
jgi:flagellar biosynthesis protein FlhB